MSTKLKQLLEALQQLNLQLRSQNEQGEAIIPAVNQQLDLLARLELGPFILEDDIVCQLPYLSGHGPSDSWQVYQAAIAVPRGVGILLWDQEAYVEAHERPETLAADMLRHFMPYDECPLAVRALLAPYVPGLLTRLIELMDLGERGKLNQEQP